MMNLISKTNILC